MTARDAILAALQGKDSTLVRPEVALKLPEGDLWTCFEEQFTKLGGRFITRPQLNELCQQLTWIEPAARPFVPEYQAEMPLDALWDCEVGISLADLAIAQTGSLMVRSGDGRARLSTLAPPLNIILVHRDHIVRSLAEAIARMTDRNSAIITGPSRTADIEGVLVRGIHGPKELCLHILETHE